MLSVPSDAPPPTHQDPFVREALQLPIPRRIKDHRQGLVWRLHIPQLHLILPMGRETLSVDRLQRPQVLGPGISGRAAPSSGACSAFGGGGLGLPLSVTGVENTGSGWLQRQAEYCQCLIHMPPAEHAPTLIASKLGHGGSSAEEPEAEMSPQSS